MQPSNRSLNHLFGLTLILAPLLLATATMYWDGGSVGLTGGVLTVFSFTCWIGAIIALSTRLQPSMPRSGVALSALGVLACVAGTNFGVEGIFESVLGITDLSDTIMSTATGSTVAAMVAAFFLPGALFPFVLLILAVLLMRARSFPIWCGVLLAIGAVAFPLSRITRVQWIALAADLLLVVPLVWLGLQYLREKEPAETLPVHPTLERAESAEGGKKQHRQ